MCRGTLRPLGDPIQQRPGTLLGIPLRGTSSILLEGSFTSHHTPVSPLWGSPTSSKTPVSCWGASPSSWDTSVSSWGHPMTLRFLPGCLPSSRGVPALPPDPPVSCVFPRAEVASRGSPGVPERPSPPSAAGWAEFLNASGGARGEGGAVALLTLSDQEQHELYEAARLVQGAFRKYRVCTPLLLEPQNPRGLPGAPPAWLSPQPRSLPPGPEAEGAAGAGCRRHPALLPQVQAGTEVWGAPKPPWTPLGTPWAPQAPPNPLSLPHKLTWIALKVTGSPWAVLGDGFGTVWRALDAWGPEHMDMGDLAWGCWDVGVDLRCPLCVRCPPSSLSSSGAVTRG